MTQLVLTEAYVLWTYFIDEHLIWLYITLVAKNDITESFRKLIEHEDAV